MDDHVHSVMYTLQFRSGAEGASQSADERRGADIERSSTFLNKCTIVSMLHVLIIFSSIFILVGWDKTVHDHLMALASNPVETLWPRDTLFK